jgi:tripartite-type tricarboxylate transporter receptor subunit TctC
LASYCDLPATLFVDATLHHLAMEMLKQEAGIKLTHVPYRGGGPAGVAVLAGDVAGMFGGGSVFPMVKSGQLRGLSDRAA